MAELTLLEQLAQAKKDRAIALETAIETRELQNELAYVNSDRYITDEIEARDDATLMAITKPLAEISDKHFSYYQEFNYGAQANALIGAIRSVMLQKKLGFVAVEEACMLNPQLATFRDLVDTHAQSFPDAIGRNTYFDKLSRQLVPGAVGNADKTLAILEKLGRHLGLISPDFSQITQEKFAFVEERSVIRETAKYEDNKLLDPANNDEIVDNNGEVFVSV